jgi:hypothetical protein
MTTLADRPTTVKLNRTSEDAAKTQDMTILIGAGVLLAIICYALFASPVDSGALAIETLAGPFAP